MRQFLFTTLSLFILQLGIAQDTTFIQTLTYDSTGRDYMFQFPPDDGTSYEKVIMLYSMRCKDGLVTTQGAPNDHGCGEWDYSCNTFITDSSKTDSIRATHASHVISNFSGTTYNYTTQPTYSYYQFAQQEVVYNTTNSESIATVGSGSDNIMHPFATSNRLAKTQYLWTASELTTAGLTAGDITGLQLNVLTANEDANFLRIRLKSTSETVLDENAPETDGFTEVYFLNTTFTSGINQFNFYNNFTWDGTSNLIVEFSYTNGLAGSDNTVEGHDIGLNMALVSTVEDKYLEFSGSGNVDITDSDYSTVVNEVSVVFWAYGNPEALPANTSTFEAVDASNNRQVHAHLPWSNSGIYWDCGNVGGYDRINKTASESELEGQWHHWAFVKNANTGEMKIYLDGEVWHSGTGKTKAIDVDEFRFGSNVGENYPYFGFMDNFSVWDTELSQSEIQDWMYKDVDATHPKYSNLINYFNLNDGSGTSIADLSPAAVPGIHSGVPAWKSHRGRELFKNFEASTFRPNTSFIQGDYDMTITPVVVLDSLINTQNAVYTYQVNGTDLEQIGTDYYYQAGYEYIYDAVTLDKVDSNAVATEGTIDITELTYYNKYPSVFEIMSFVTPYGIGLDLGMEGKTWTFDVTDLLPVLRGNKRMYFTGGIYQEDLDIKFLFIEGTPARDVIDIQQIWRAGTQRNYSSIMSDTYFEPRTVEFNPAASMFKIRAAITGHGQEGEFIARNHFINIDGGSNEFQWQVWKECAANPVYPQGGTWVYDRAGWCPGMATDMQEFEITDIISGPTATIDYGVTAGSGDSRYIVNCQLVSYGDPNFDLDAEIVEIQRPSKRVEFDRVNPVCYNPTVVIRNTGSFPLTSLNIEFGVSGGTSETYTWTGNLEFDEKEEVILPLQDAGFWLGDEDHIFTVTISEPNGGTDEYANNNTQTSEFDLPDMYEEPFLIFLRTNYRGWETSYYVKDVEGNTIYTKTGLSSSTTYRDTLDLAPGCYTIELFDSGNDGLQWWANTAQGTGFMRLFNVSNGAMLKNFENDFGSEFRYSFVVDNFTHIKDRGEAIQTIDVYPNPSTGLVNVDLHLEAASDIEIQITDVAGRTVQEKRISNVVNSHTQFDLSGENEGVYFCRIKTSEGITVKKVIFSK